MTNDRARKGEIRGIAEPWTDKGEKEACKKKQAQRSRKSAAREWGRLTPAIGQSIGGEKDRKHATGAQSLRGGKNHNWLSSDVMTIETNERTGKIRGKKG